MPDMIVLQFKYFTRTHPRPGVHQERPPNSSLQDELSKGDVAGPVLLLESHACCLRRGRRFFGRRAYHLCACVCVCVCV